MISSMGGFSTKRSRIGSRVKVCSRAVSRTEFPLEQFSSREMNSLGFERSIDAPCQNTGARSLTPFWAYATLSCPWERNQSTASGVFRAGLPQR